MASEKARRFTEDPKTAKDSVAAGDRTETQFESLADKVKHADTSRDKDEASQDKTSGAYYVGKFEVGDGKERAGKEENGENKQPSLEEISKLRQKAQQNSAEAIKGAQERYEKAKEKTGQGLGSAAKYAKEKGSRTKDSVVEGAQKTSEQMSEKGYRAKDTVVEGAQSASQYVAEKGSQVKDTVVQGAQKSSQYIAEKGAKAKDTVLEGAQRTSKYAKDKAVAAKDATGEMALDAKDRAAVTGWTAAHYTTEKTVEGTKVATRAVQGVMEKAAELATKPFSAAKQAAVSTGESMEGYTARKKEEAERGMEAKKVAEGQESFQEGDYTEESSEEAQHEHHQWQQQKGSSFLSAIGETIAEIAQTTKELLIGKNEPRAQDSAAHEASQSQYSEQEEHKTRE